MQAGNPIKQLTKLYRYLRENRRSYYLGALALLGTNACALFIPWLLKLAIESLQSVSTSVHSPAFYGGLIMISAILHGVIRVSSRTTILHAARRIEYKIRDEMYEKLLLLDQSFFAHERTGDLMSRFSNDLTNIRMLIGFGVMNVFNTVIIYSAALTLMIRISPFLTICSILPFPVMILIVKKISASMFRRSKKVQEELARMTSVVEENIAAAPVIKAYCREEPAIAAFKETSSQYMRSNMRIAQLRGLLIPIMAGTGTLGTLVVLLVGGSRVTSGAMTLGDFVAFNGYMAMLIWPTIVFGWMLNMMQRGAASLERLQLIISAEPQVVEPADPVDPPEIRGELEFKNLTFTYKNGAEPILDSISLKIPAGSRIGIVGAIGSGKSTLVRLISHLYPVKDGEIFIDGIDINRLKLEKLRSAIGYVPQESFLFSRTIHDNIALGRENASEEEISEAARLASLDSDVQRFPCGFATLVGERGITLSGGQKQRTAIARALIKNPSILILDDPLSAVDARTEETILEGLAGFYGNRTVIIVSHRLSALRECDIIMLLENGRVAEQGNHDQLVAMDGKYAAIHREQQLRREIEGY